MWMSTTVSLVSSHTVTSEAMDLRCYTPLRSSSTSYIVIRHRIPDTLCFISSIFLPCDVSLALCFTSHALMPTA